MDAIAIAAEIATILQLAEVVPVGKRRRVRRAERQAVYLAYQREAYRLMAGVSHLSLLGQLKTTSWRNAGITITPMIAPLASLVPPPKPHEPAYVSTARDCLNVVSRISGAMAPSAGSVIGEIHAADTKMRDRILRDAASVRDSTGDFLAAFAQVRLVGRPDCIAAADIIRELLQVLFSKIPVRERRKIDAISSHRRQNGLGSQAREFNEHLAALGLANTQFLTLIRSDRVSRSHGWQIWMPVKSELRSASKLVEESRSVNSGAAARSSIRQSLIVES